MSGIMQAMLFGGGATISVTVGTDSAFDPKTGQGASQYGYANAANTLNGGIIGARSPTTFQGATINGIFELDDFASSAGFFYFILDGNQMALSITQISLAGGPTYGLSLFGFVGGQTTWRSSSHPSLNPFVGSPVNVVIS